MKYLTESQSLQLLKANRMIEQWLGTYEISGVAVIKFVILNNESRERPNLWLMDCEDIGDESYLDIYSFNCIDEDNPYGKNIEFDSIEEMLSYCYENFSASKERFVGKGMLQEVYLEYISNK